MRFEELIAWARAEAAEEAAKQAADEATKNTKVQAILELLEDCGEIPDTLPEKLHQFNEEELKKYLKLAARADSIEEFIKMME